jgi:molecular chaperone HscB
VDAEKNTAMPADFLMQQMEWREALAEVPDAAALDKLRTEVEVGRARALSSLDWLIDEKADYPAASREVRALMFIERFAEDVEAKSDQWGQ